MSKDTRTNNHRSAILGPLQRGVEIARVHPVCVLARNAGNYRNVDDCGSLIQSAVDIGKTASDRLIEFIEIVEDLVAEVPEYFGVGSPRN